MDNKKQGLSLLQMLVKWRVQLTIILVIAAIAAAIFSGPAFIPPLYKSYAILYPANIEPYSEESETEQMLQIMQSQDITDSVIRTFDLAKHYKIAPEYKYFRSTLLYEYSQHISISKTNFESVLIEVLDEDPDTAAQIVQAIIDFYDKKVQHLHKSKYFEVLNMYELQLAMKKALIDSLQDRMYLLGKEYGIFEYSNQSHEIMKALLGTYEGSSSKIDKNELDRLRKSMEAKGGELLMLIEMITNESRSYVDTKLDYEMTLRFINSELTYSNIVTPPYPSDKKEYPIRWLIVVLTVLATLFVAVILIILFENQHSILGITNQKPEPAD